VRRRPLSAWLAGVHPPASQPASQRQPASHGLAGLTAQHVGPIDRMQMLFFFDSRDNLCLSPLGGRDHPKVKIG